MPKKAFIFSNNKDYSKETSAKLRKILTDRDYGIIDTYSEDADLLVCIGGDGTFLSFVHKCRFPSAPILGINTGHLGFFQESSPDKMENAVDEILAGKYTVQTIKPVQAKIVTSRNEFTRIGLNEILVRGQFSHVSQFSVSIDETKVQDFSGDGILISTPVGSTAYNYSLDGALVAPANLAHGGDHVFRAKGAAQVEDLLSAHVRVKHQLHQALPVPQPDEDHAAQVPGALHPAGEVDDLAHVLFGQKTAVMISFMGKHMKNLLL
jgi:hypothetical protein